MKKQEGVLGIKEFTFNPLTEDTTISLSDNTTLPLEKGVYYIGYNLIKDEMVVYLRSKGHKTYGSIYMDRGLEPVLENEIKKLKGWQQTR